MGACIQKQEQSLEKKLLNPGRYKLFPYLGDVVGAEDFLIQMLRDIRELFIICILVSKAT